MKKNLKSAMFLLIAFTITITSANRVVKDTKVSAMTPYSQEGWNIRGTPEPNHEFVNEILTLTDRDYLEDIKPEDLSKITTLDLTDKSISEIPYGINYLYNLEELILDDNNITYIPNDVLEKVKSLDNFSIRNNYLIELDKTIYNKFNKSNFSYNLLNNKDQYEISVDTEHLDYESLEQNLDSQEFLRRYINKVTLSDQNIDEVSTTKELPLDFEIQVELQEDSKIELFQFKKSLRESKDLKEPSQTKTYYIEEPNIQRIEDLNNSEEDIDKPYKNIKVSLMLNTIELESQILDMDSGFNQDLESESTEDEDNSLEQDSNKEEQNSNQEEQVQQLMTTKNLIPRISTLPKLEGFENPKINNTLPEDLKEDSDFEEVSPDNGVIFSETLEQITSESSTQVFIQEKSSFKAPRIWNVTPSTIEWTNKSITLNIDAQSFITDQTLEYTYHYINPNNTETLLERNNESFVQVSKSGKYRITVKDKQNQTSNLVYEVNNIDTTAPLPPTAKVHLESTGKLYSTSINAKGWANKTTTIESLNRTQSQTNAKAGEESYQSPIDYMFIQLSNGTRLKEDSLDKYFVHNLKESNVKVGYVDKAGNESILTSLTSSQGGLNNLWVDTEPPEILNYHDDRRVGTWVINKLTTFNLTDYKDNLSKNLEITFDRGNSWDKVIYPEHYKKVFDTYFYANIKLKDEADNVSDTLEIWTNADNVIPILKGYRLEPSTWTNSNVKIIPEGDHTGSVWREVGIDGHFQDSTTHIGYYLTRDNFTNKIMKAGDRARNYAINEIPVTVTNIDKIDPYIQSATSKNNGDGTCTVTVIGGDTQSGPHSTEGYSINDSKFTNKNTITLPINQTMQKVKVQIKDKATNVSVPNYVYVKNGQVVGVPALVSTDKTFGVWGKADHRITISGGTHQNGVNRRQYRIKTIRNANGQTVNTYSAWTNYSSPFIISQEGELQLEVRIVPNSGTDYIESNYPILIDKVSPIKPNLKQWVILNGKETEYPMAGTTKNDPSKFIIYSIIKNWSSGDSLSGVESATRRVAGNLPVESIKDKDRVYEQFANSGHNYLYLVDRAGNISPSELIGNNATGNNRAKVFSQTRSNNHPTDKPVKIDYRFRVEYYWGHNAKPVTKLYHESEAGFDKLPTETHLNNNVVDSSSVLTWLNSNGTVNSSGQQFIDHTHTFPKNGKYKFYVRDFEDGVSEFNVTIDNIDLLPPKITKVTRSTPVGNFTSDPITLTVTATDDTDIKDATYSFDGGVTFSNSNSTTITSNGDIKIVVKDGFGRISSIHTESVQNIDKELPVIRTVDVTKLPNDKLKLKINSADIGTAGLPVNYISFNDGSFISNNEIAIGTNEFTKVSIIDKANNRLDSYIFANDDGEIFITPAIRGNTPDNKWTTNNVELTIYGGYLPTGIRGYVYNINDSSSWETYYEDNKPKFTEEGIYRVKAKALGNEDESESSPEFTVKIDRTAPILLEATSSHPTDWTNQDVTITVKYSDNLSTELQYSFDNGITWQEENYKKYTKNTSDITIVIKDETGNKSTPYKTSITNIDKTKPATPKLNLEGTPFQDETFTITDVSDLGGSKVKSIEYKIGNNPWTPYDYDFEISEMETQIKIPVEDKTPNINIQVRVIDHATNETLITEPINENILEVTLPIKLNGLDLQAGQFEENLDLNIENNGTPIKVSLQVDDANSIPLTEDVGIDWENLVEDESKTKSQLTMIANSNNTLLPTTPPETILSTQEKTIADMNRGRATYNLKYNTGTTRRNGINGSYKLVFKVENLYK